MTYRRLKPVIKKEFLQIWRDKRSLTVLLIFPSLLVLVIGFALNFDVKHISVAVFDMEKSPESREFIRSFSNSEYFNFNFTVENQSDAENLLNEGKALLVVVIPNDFSKQLLAGKDATIQILVDGSNANTATTAIGYISALIETYSSGISTTVLAKRGQELFTPIDFRPRIWYNPELSSTKFLVPGLVGFILMISAVISTSLSIVREKERGTMEQMIVSALRTEEIIIGKAVVFLVIGLVASGIVLVVGFIVFDVSVKGSMIWLYTGIVIFLLGGLGQGLLISTVTQTQQIAFMVSVFSSLLPSFLLSGFVFPIRSMPVVLQLLSNITPTKFFLIVVRSIVLKGAGFSAFWEQLIYMSIFAAIMIGVSSVRLMRKTE